MYIERPISGLLIFQKEKNMNTNEPEKTIDLCFLTDLFVQRAVEAGIPREAIFSLLDRQMNTNPFAKKICFVQSENLNLAPVLLQHGIAAVPARNSELQMLMETLLLPECEGKGRSVLIPECLDQMANLLLVLRNANIRTNVLGLGECPNPYEALVESWLNVAAEVPTVSEESGEEDETPETAPIQSADPAEEVSEAAESVPEPVVEETKPAEVICEAAESVPEPAEEASQAAEVKVSEPEIHAGEPIVEEIKPREEPKSFPKVKMDREIPLQEKARNLGDSLAMRTSMFSLPSFNPGAFQKMNLNPKEQTVDPSRIVKCLARCFQWLSKLLDEPNNKKRITKCAGYIVQLCGIANRISGLELSKTQIECREFIEKEIHPQWPVAELTCSGTTTLEELPQIEKKISSEFKKLGLLEPEPVVWDRLSKNIRKMKGTRKITQDMLSPIQRDVKVLLGDYEISPENDKICNLIQQIRSKIPEKVEISEEMKMILEEIEERELAEQLAACSEKELNDKYQNDPNIQKLRKFFRNKILVVVGGTPRKEQKESFEKAFQCEIDWGETDHCQSLDRFKAAIQNDRVEALLTLQDKASHKHSLELYTKAKKAGKKLFRVAHMNPILVAYKMMKQYSNNIQ